MTRDLIIILMMRDYNWTTVPSRCASMSSLGRPHITESCCVIRPPAVPFQQLRPYTAPDGARGEMEPRVETNLSAGLTRQGRAKGVSL
jgi:hypothetical protein